MFLNISYVFGSVGNSTWLIENNPRNIPGHLGFLNQHKNVNCKEPSNDN
jgi:hypothetical protein